MEKSYIQKAIDIVGGQSELARRCHVTQQHVYNWLHRDKELPAERAIAIEQATDGQVTRFQLRPDITWN